MQQIVSDIRSPAPQFSIQERILVYVGSHFVFKSNNDERMWRLEDLIIEYSIVLVDS
mgnify:CR=1 FL=1